MRAFNGCTCNFRYVTCTQAQENPLNRRCTTAREALEGSLMFLFIDKVAGISQLSTDVDACERLLMRPMKAMRLADEWIFFLLHA